VPATELRNLPSNKTKPRYMLALAGGAVVIYFLLIAAYQHWSGASEAAFGGYPDEPSHYISGLMIRDYGAAGFPAHPVTFAVDYYTHMPFLAIGYWPPFFYILEAAWMALFGYHRATVLLLPALLAALLSGTVFKLLVDRLAAPAAFLAGLLLLVTPPLLLNNGLIMVDTAFSLLCFWAGLAFVRWIDTGSVEAALLTGLLAALGLLTKVNSIHLILLPPLVFLVTGRWRLLLRGTFWIIPAVVAVLWGPWMLYARKLMSAGFGGLYRPAVAHIAMEFGRALVDNLGWLLIPILLGGAIAFRHARFDTSALVCALLPLCYVVFLLAARVEIESRFLIPLLAPVMVLVGLALGALSERVARAQVPANWIETAVAGVILVAFAATLGRHVPMPPKNQIRPVVEFIRARGGAEDASILVPSEAEGPFIAELASGETHRPHRFMIRPNKLLATVDWNGGFYKARYQTQEEMISLFDKLPIRYTVVAAQVESRTRTHDRLLRTALETHPERWRRLDAPPGPWLVYERINGRAIEAAQTAAILRQYLTERILQLSPEPAAVQ
jgi:hypothetical protein